MRTAIKKSDLKLDVNFTPIQKAELAIMNLQHEPALQKDAMLGGPTPPQMKAENERKDAEYNRRRLEIIAQHGVVDDYLKPLREKEQELIEALARVRQGIADLEALKK